MRVSAALVVAIFLCQSGVAAAGDLSTLDLTGEWYVLVHHRDDGAADTGIAGFRDFAWSVKHGERAIDWQTFPYVLFSDDLELARKEAMREQRAWEPSEALWQRIRGRVAVAARASQAETLRGSRDEGYRSEATAGARGARTIRFSRDWTVEFAEDAVRIAITDSLSGGIGLEGLADSIVYEIAERAGPDELRGTYRERTKRGTFRMVRSREREIVK